MYVDSVGSGSPMDMETDGPLLDDVNMLKKTVEEEATQVRSGVSVCIVAVNVVMSIWGRLESRYSVAALCKAII